MDKALTIIFFEDYFVSTILPNESAWEILKVNGNDKTLLYFYVSAGDIRNDEFAKERFEARDINSFGYYYEAIIDSTKNFRRFDLELEPINLLNDVIDDVKEAYYERITSFFPNININSEIPLNICFIPGISRESQDKIIQYFLNNGFVLNFKGDYFESFVKILQRKGIVSPKSCISIVESYFGDLLFHYIEFNEQITKKETEALIGKGIDHRIANLSKLLVEKAATKNSSRIKSNKELLEKEIKSFHKKASEEIKKFYYGELNTKVELSDFSSARVIIDQRELDKMSSESFQFIKFKYESFISKHSNLARTDKIFLNGNVLSSDEFSQFFQKNFGASKVIKPYENFNELLSRGVFTSSPSSTEIIKEEIEIKIIISSIPPIPNPGLNKTAPATNANSQSKEKATQIPPLPQVKAHSPPSVPMIDKSESEEKKASPVPPKIPSLKNESGEKKNVGAPIVPTIPKIPEFSKGVEEKSKVGIPPLPPLPQKK